jgi:hypothetical protein
MSGIEGDPQAIEHLRQAIQSFRGRVTEVLDGLEGEIPPVESALEDARQYWEWECERRRDEVSACLAEAAKAAAAGAWVDCSPLRAALYEAEDRLRQVIEQQNAVRHAREAFSQVAQRYESFLEDQSSRMNVFLTARATSLEAFLATPAPGETSGMTLGSLLTSSQRPGPTAPPMPVEFKEGNLGGPENRG